MGSVKATPILKPAAEGEISYKSGIQIWLIYWLKPMTTILELLIFDETKKKTDFLT
jgi:hypothetical protein